MTRPYHCRTPIVFLVLLYLCLVGHPQAVEGLCQANGIPHGEDADVRFALMLQLRTRESEPSNQCQISAKALQHYLTVEWLIDRINSYDNNTGYIPGIKIGYTSYDDCGDPTYSARNAVSFFNNSLSYMSSSCPVTENVPNIGIIGPTSSSASLTVSSLLRDHKIPIISPSSAVLELSNKTQYPTFLRTVASDIQQMTLVVDMLEKLQWTYIAVVYQNDYYGKSSRNILAQKAKERGICIHKEHVFLPQDDKDLGNQFESILEGAHGNSIAVVMIVNNIQAAENVMYAVETRVSSNNRGLHFILLDAVNTDTSVFRADKQGQGTLAISTANDMLAMDDLKADINQMFEQFASKPDDHDLIKEYIETHGRPSVFVPDSLDAFLPATIHAVMALVQGMKSLHADICVTNVGLCNALRNKIKDGQLLKQVKKTEVNYAVIPKEIVPTAFHDTGFSFRFDNFSDIVMGGSHSSYSVHSYDASIQNYKKVGSYIDGTLSLDVARIKWLSPAGGPMQGVPTSMCAKERCKECQNNNLIPVMFLEGDVYIVGIFSLHKTNPEDPFNCGDYRAVGNDAIVAEGFLFAIEELRAKTGINYGAIGFDACYSQLRMTSILTDYFSDISPLYSEIFPNKIPRQKVVGVIGCLSSGCTIPTTTFFTPLNVPVMSYASSSPDLDDRIDFPFFLRTVPSDVFQAQVMVNIIKKMGWERVGLLYVNNNYGAKGMQAFRRIVDKEGSEICAAKEIAINEKEAVDNADIFEARRILTSQNVKVVVFFGIDTRVRDFIENLERYKRYGNFIFLASEEWGDNEVIKNAGVNSARGSLTLKLQNIGLESEDSFKRHLRDKKPFQNDTNVWYREFWQNKFRCNLRGGFHNEFDRECSMNEQLSSSQIDKVVADARTRHAINAVYAMGKGLNEVKNRYCKKGLESCDYLRRNAAGVAEEIKKQTRKDGSEQLSVFDSDGNGAIGFDVYNIQEVGATYEYVKVGTFGSGSEDFDPEQVKVYDKYGDKLTSLEAVCGVNMCTECKHRKAPPPTVEEEDTSVSEFRDSDILVISLVIVLILAVAVLVVAFIICFQRKYKVMSKKLEYRADDQIYDEPIRTVYPGHSLPLPANLPVSDPNICPYVYALNRDGVSNPTFLSDSDRIDSVSQVMSNRAMNIDTPYSPSSSGNITNQHSLQSKFITNQPSNQYDPSLAHKGGGQVNMNRLHQEYQGSEPSVRPSSHASVPTMQRENSIQYTSVATTPMPLNATNLQASQNILYNNENIKVVQGPNGQLIAYLAAENGQPISNPRILTKQNSMHPEYGPYSFASTLQNQQGQAHAHNQGLVNQNADNNRSSNPTFSDNSMRQNNEMPSSYMALNYAQAPHDNIEMQNINPIRRDMYDNQSQRGPTNATQMKETPTNQMYPPMQYAIPTHVISSPNSYSTAIPISQPGVVLRNVPLNAHPEAVINPENLGMMDPSLQNKWMVNASNQNGSEENLSEDHWGEESREGNSDPRGQSEGPGLYHYPDSNSLSSIPDVISGKMPYTPATPLKTPRNASLESINLETNPDFVHDSPNMTQIHPVTAGMTQIETTPINNTVVSNV